MSKCKMAMGKNKEGLNYAQQAQKRYPQEAQALHMVGLLSLRNGYYKQALADFNAYEQKLPGNPMTIFFKGVSYEGLGNRNMAANEYYRFLKINNQGDYARHAYSRLTSWGFLK